MLNNYRVVFVVEYLRHAHRAPVFKNHNQQYRMNGTNWGDLSPKGRADAYAAGMRRKREYSRLLPQEYDPQEVLTMTSDYQRTE